MSQNGNNIEIQANHRRVERDNDNVVETDFDIQVPSAMRLDVNSFSAPIKVKNVQGEPEMTFSADIALESPRVRTKATTWTSTASAATSGCACPTTRSGSLDFDSFSGRFDSDLPVTLTASSNATSAAPERRRQRPLSAEDVQWGCVDKALPDDLRSTNSDRPREHVSQGL